MDGLPNTPAGPQDGSAVSLAKSRLADPSTHTNTHIERERKASYRPSHHNQREQKIKLYVFIPL